MERKEIMRRFEAQKSILLTEKFNWQNLGDCIDNREKGKPALMSSFESRYVLLPGDFVTNYIYTGKNGKNYFMIISKNSPHSWPQCLAFGLQKEDGEVHLAYEASPLTGYGITLITLPDVECFVGKTRIDMPARSVEAIYAGDEINDRQLTHINEGRESSLVFRRALINAQQGR